MSMASALFILLPGHYLKTKPKIPVLSRSTHNDMLGIYRWVSVDPGTVCLVAIGISGWILFGLFMPHYLVLRVYCLVSLLDFITSTACECASQSELGWQRSEC